MKQHSKVRKLNGKTKPENEHIKPEYDLDQATSGCTLALCVDI